MNRLSYGLMVGAILFLFPAGSAWGQYLLTAEYVVRTVPADGTPETRRVISRITTRLASLGKFDVIAGHDDEGAQIAGSVTAEPNDAVRLELVHRWWQTTSIGPCSKFIDIGVVVDQTKKATPRDAEHRKRFEREAKPDDAGTSFRWIGDTLAMVIVNTAVVRDATARDEYYFYYFQLQPIEPGK